MKACPKCGAEYPDTTTLCPADGIALEKTDDSLLGQMLTEKYRIEERLSEGGMGAVYRATHVLMDKTVAIKVLRPSLAADEKIVARFSREARAASRISHPHAISVTDFGEDENGIVFLVMEYLSGRTLKDTIRSEGPMPLSRVVEIIKQVGDALIAAHEQNVVHRDLKSDNIMLVSTSTSDYAKVLDFGIAKIKEPDGSYDPALTSPDLVIGTPQYMSPEQCSQSPDIDARSDIYSLGIIIFEMLVGHVPFTGESSTVVMLKHLQQSPPSVLDERPDLSPAVGKVVERALAKQPQDRYQTIGELLEDLLIAAEMEPVRDSEPLPAIPPSLPLEDDEDEETLVRKRLTTPMEPPPIPAEPPPASTINLWKVLVPSAVGLLVVFAIIYAFTSSSQPTPAENTPSTLTADPNSQPVEPAQPPTGAPEAGIPAGGQTNPNDATPTPAVGASPSTTEDPNVAPNVNLENENSAATPLPSPRQVIEPSPAPTKLPTPRPALTPPVTTPAAGAPGNN